MGQNVFVTSLSQNKASEYSEDDVLSRFRATLLAHADQLTAQLGGNVVPIGRICYEAGILIERSDALPALSASMVLPRSNKEFAKILLPKTERYCYDKLSNPTPYERFCVAHELAHLIIFKNYKVIPESKSDYWRHEILCDLFARRLLMPQWLLSIVERQESPIHYATALASVARVPWIQAARRIAEVFSGITFFRIGLNQNGDLSILGSSMENRKEQSRKLRGMLRIRIEKFRLSEHRYFEFDLHSGSIFNSNIKSLGNEGIYKIQLLRKAHLENEIFSSFVVLN